MLFNQKFKKSLLIYFLGLLLFTFFKVIYVKFIAGSSTSLNLFFDIFYGIVYESIFWVAIYYLIKDKSSALTGYLITIAGVIIVDAAKYIIFSDQQMTNVNEAISLSSKITIIRTLIFSISLGVFGKLHFKKPKGIILSIIPLIWLGTRTLLFRSSTHSLEFVNQFLPYKYTVETIDVIPYIHLLYSPLVLILFGWLYNEIIKDRIPGNFSCKTVKINHTLNKIQFSIIYWMFWLIFFFGIFLSGEIQFYQQKWILILFLITGSIGMYFIISIYRNFLLSYLLNFGRYPSWLYLALNIPIINFFAWLIVLLKKNDLQEIDLTKMLKKYDIYDNNVSIKRFLVVMGILVFIYSLVRLGFGELDSIERSVTYLVSIGLFIWYFTKPGLVYYLITVLALVTIFSLTEENNSFGHETFILHTTSFSGMLGLLALYPLFHFDKMKINGLRIINKN